MLSAVANEYLQIGDLVVLEDENKFVTASGIGDTAHDIAVTAMDSEPLRQAGEFSSRAVFVVQSQGTWTQLQNFKMAVERQGLSLEEGKVSPVTLPQYRESLHERERNEAETVRLAGREVRFGMVIQLMHHATHKYLSTSRMATAGRMGSKLIVDGHAGESSWFRVKPRLRVHNEGEKVHAGDPVILEELNAGQRLMLDEPHDDGTQFVISVGDLPGGATGSFKMRIYRSFDDDAERELLLAGAACTIFHTEMECFLGAHWAGSALVDLIQGSTSNAVWQILYRDEKDGSACRWDGTFRIRHVATGQFLAIQSEKGARRRDAIGGVPRRLSIGSRETGIDLAIGLVDGRQASEPELLFRFDPQYSNITGNITTMHFLRILHELPDGLAVYLHANPRAVDLAPSVGAPGAAPASEAPRAPPDSSSGIQTLQLAAGEDGATAAPIEEVPGNLVSGQPVPLLLTINKAEADVFAVRHFPREDLSDLQFVVHSTHPFTTFIKSGEAILHTPRSGNQDAAAQPLKMKAITKTISELICFVTKSDNLDPFTREGMPIDSRQLMLSEQGILKLAIDCVEVPFRAGLYNQEDVTGADKLDKSMLEHKKLALLAMRLVRHILRGQSSNKLNALSLVPSLLGLLPLGWGASECLTELFTDNEMVDRVPDATIQMFVDLIRTKGRLARYVRFLEVLCACRGKAVRVNQWRVARMLLEEAPELLLTLELHADADDKVYVSGDVKYFPKLAEVGGTMEISTWIRSTSAEMADYFTALTSLYAALVRGRNLRTSPVLQGLLPYSLVCKIITDEALHKTNLDISRRFVTIATDLWVNNDILAPPAEKREAHPTMAFVKTVRVWSRVPEIATERVLSSRKNLSADVAPDWTQFNELKAFALAFISKYPFQNAMEIVVNRLLLELAKLVHALILTGFYRSNELVEIIGPLLQLLDGRKDVTGRQSDPPTARYEKETTVKLNTVVVMECKEWLCQIFQLVCTIRLDIRLSLLLGMYHTQRGKSQDRSAFAQLDFEHIFSVLQIGSVEVKKEQEHHMPMAMGTHSRSRVVPFNEDAEAGKQVDVVAILIDLTYYKSPELVSAALGLLVRQFEQKKVLDKTARQVQLLVKPSMCQMYGSFDNLLSQLNRLAERRRLYDDELYRAVVLMGQITARCYDQPDDDQGGGQAAEGSDPAKKPPMLGGSSAPEGSASGRSKGSRMTRRSMTQKLTDGASGLQDTFLMCVGKATGQLGSDKLSITLLEPGCPKIYFSHRLELLGRMYDVLDVDGDIITLKESLSCASTSQLLSPALRNGQPDVMWLMLERQVAGEANPDMQLLLYNMHAYGAPQKLLRLPVKRQIVFEEVAQREVMLGAYRLLKALCNGFRVTQMVLLPDIPGIVEKTDYSLVASDITPTDCLVAILRDNPQGCLQVDDKLIRKFVNLAADTKAPRFLKFLRNITGPERQPMLRTQTLVMQGLCDNVSAQLLYNGETGKAERRELIESNDLKVHPRGKLAYHVELIGLVARCTEGIAPVPESLARDMFPMTDLLDHIALPELPLVLKIKYLKVLDEAYFFVKRAANDMASSPEMLRLIEHLTGDIEAYATDVLSTMTPDFVENLDESAKTHYAVVSIMYTMALFYEGHYIPGRVSDEIYQASVAFGRAVVGLQEEIMADDCMVTEELPLEMLLRCLKALRDRDVIDLREHIDPIEQDDHTTDLKTAGLAVMATTKLVSKGAMTKDTLTSLERLSRASDKKPAASPMAVSPDASPEPIREQSALAQGVGRIATGGAYRTPSPGTLGVSDQDDHPQMQLRSMIDAYKVKCGVEAEFSKLVDAFMTGLEVDDGHHASSGSSAKLMQRSERTPLQNVIEQLKPRPGTELDVHQAVACARVLCTCVEQAPNEKVLRVRQNMLTSFGAAAVVVRLVSSVNPELYRSGLLLGKELLRGGNSKVQQTLYDLVNSTDTANVAPLDGTSGNFFTRMRDSLRLAVKEIPEHLSYLEMQADARLNFDDVTQGLAGATIELLRADLEKEFVSNAHPELLLGFLKELCEGHYVLMQDLLHDQPNTMYDIDIVVEVYDLLTNLEGQLSKHNVKQADLACQMLTEVLQGNTTGINSEALLETKLVDLCNRLLVTARNHVDRRVLSGAVARRKGTAKGGDVGADAAEISPDAGDMDEEQMISVQDMLELRNSVLTLLHALLETAEMETLKQVEAVVDLQALASLAGHWHDAYYDKAFKSATSGPPERQASVAEARRALETGFQAILLLRRITDTRANLQQTTYASMSPASRAHYKKFVGRVELCKENGDLERIYFRVPHHFRIAPRTKEAVLWGVDRDTPGQAVQEFLLMAHELHVEVMWQEVVGEFMLWKLIVRFEPIVNNMSVVLAIIQNLMILIDSSVIYEALEEVPDAWDTGYSATRMTLATIQILTCTLATIVTFVRSTFNTVLKIWFSQRDLSAMDDTLYALRHPVSRFSTFFHFFSVTVGVICTDLDLLGRLSFVAFAVCGLVVRNGERFFVIHLMQVILQNKGLLDVLRAVTTNGKQLMLTSLLLAIVVWMFAVWGAELRADFLPESETEDADLLCRSPGHCWLEIVNSLATGDVADLLMQRPRYETHPSPHRYWVVWLYQFLLFVIVVLILLNVVFGIIIDTFGELRGEKAAKKAHMENVCFVCGIDRFTFDTKGDGFNEHIRGDHWMWTYLAMMIHVREKDPTDYNGWETYVAAKMADKDTSFMPSNTAIVLQAAQDAEEEAAEEVKKRLKDVETQNNRIFALLETMQRDQAIIMERMPSVAGQQL